MKANAFNQFEKAGTEHELMEIRHIITQGGYAGFSRFLGGFKEKITQFEDDQATEVIALIHKAKKLFPEPQNFSPSWERIWLELAQIITCKIEVLQSIPAEERDGEWQVIMDNPYSNQEVVCYPGLSFLEAAYLYAYFRPELVKNEYIRLQKIQNLLMNYGS